MWLDSCWIVETLIYFRSSQNVARWRVCTKTFVRTQQRPWTEHERTIKEITWLNFHPKNHFSLSFYLFLSVFLSFFFFMSFCLSFIQSFCCSVILFLCFYVFLSFCLSVFHKFTLNTHITTYLSLFDSVIPHLHKCIIVIGTLTHSIKERKRA